VVYADGAARDCPISEDKDRSDGVGVTLDLRGNPLLVELVLLDIPGVD